MKPLVSFVIPSFKSKPEYLKKSLSSALNQSYENIETIIVLDTMDKIQDKEILDTIEAFQDPRIRTIVRVLEKGYCSALNIGIKISTGKYIARLDSDDYCTPDRIEKQVKLLHDKKASLVGTWSTIIDENGQRLGELRTPTSNKSIRSQVMLHNPFVHSSILFNKKILEKVGPYNNFFDGAEDYEFYLRVISAGYNCDCVPEFLTYLRESPNSIMRGNGWMKTRRSYFLAKCKGVAKLGYTRGWDLFYAAGSFSAFFISPRDSILAKKLIGWYSNI
jgi:glycosyltransferase involved in cell wall biosynthesis